MIDYPNNVLDPTAAAEKLRSDIVLNLHDWIIQHRDYGEQLGSWLLDEARRLHQEIDHTVSDVSLEYDVERRSILAFWDAVPTDARELLVASLVMMSRLKEPEEEVAPILLAAARVFGIHWEPSEPDMVLTETDVTKPSDLPQIVPE